MPACAGMTISSPIIHYQSSIINHPTPTPHTIMLCPHCHSELKDNATFCPHCGSDANTGWKEGAEFTDLETPDYDEILENEFGDDPNSPYAKKKKASPLAIAAAVIVALAFIAAMVF